MSVRLSVISVCLSVCVITSRVSPYAYAYEKEKDKKSAVRRLWQRRQQTNKKVLYVGFGNVDNKQTKKCCT